MCVCVKKGANVTSDHHLLLAKLNLKLKKNWKGEQTERHNVSVLKDPQTKEEVNLALINKFQVLQELLKEEEADVETH